MHTVAGAVAVAGLLFSSSSAAYSSRASAPAASRAAGSLRGCPLGASSFTWPLQVQCGMPHARSGRCMPHCPCINLTACPGMSLRVTVSASAQHGLGGLPHPLFCRARGAGGGMVGDGCCGVVGAMLPGFEPKPLKDEVLERR